MADDLELRATIQAILDDRGFKSLDQALAKNRSEMSATGTSAKSLGYNFDALKQQIIGFVAAGATISFVKDAFIEFAKTERAFTSIGSQIAALGKNANGSLADVRAFIASLAEETGILDDFLAPAFNRLMLTMGDVKGVQEALSIAARFAAAGFGAVESNATSLSLALQTNTTRALRVFGIETKDAEGKGIALSEAFRLIREKADQLPKSLDDAQARVNRLALAWDNFKDSVGASVDFVIRGIQKVAGALISIQTGEAAATAGALEMERQAVAKYGAVYTDRVAAHKAAQAAMTGDAQKGVLERLAAEREANAKAAGAKQVAAEAAKKHAESEHKLQAEAISNLKERIKAEQAEQKARLAGFRQLADAHAREVAKEISDEEKLKAEVIKARRRTQREIQIINEQEKRDAAQKAAFIRQIEVESTASILGSMSQLFHGNKALAIASAIIETYYGAQLAFVNAEEEGAPWYVAAIAAAAAVAAGLARVQQIRSAEPGFDDPASDREAYFAGRKWARDMVANASKGWAAEMRVSNFGGGQSIVNHSSTFSPVTTTNVNISGYVGAGRTEMMKRLQRELDLVNRTTIRRSRVSG